MVVRLGSLLSSRRVSCTYATGGRKRHCQVILLTGTSTSALACQAFSVWSATYRPYAALTSPIPQPLSVFWGKLGYVIFSSLRPLILGFRPALLIDDCSNAEIPFGILCFCLPTLPRFAVHVKVKLIGLSNWRNREPHSSHRSEISLRWPGSSLVSRRHYNEL